MASLYNNKISATYVGLIKTLDSAVINATLRELSDGLGNQTGLFINTSGDFKATGILEFGSLKDTGENITITKFVDEADGIANNDNDTTIPTSAAIIDYVASQVTLEDLDFSGDSGSGSVDLDTQTFAIVGTANEIETSASGQQLQIGLPSSISVNLVGNVTGDVTGDLTGNVTATSVLADGVTATTQSANDNSTKVATTAYVDAQVTAEDLDFAGDTGTGSVDLDSQSLSVTGTTNQVVTSATNQTLNISLPATVHRNLQGDVTGDLTGNVTGNVTGNLTGDVTGDVTGDLTGNVTATSVLADGVTATTQTDGDNSTKVATTAYVDTAIQGHDTLAEVLTGGNTTGGTDIAVSAGDDITFTDTSKAIFGDGSDLQIYHEGTDSYIKDAGTGNLNINADQLVFKSADNTETKAIFNTNGQVELYYDNSKKLETVTNGVDITGNADVSGQITVGTSDTLLAENTLRFKSSGDAFIDQNTVGQSLYLRTSNAASLDTNAVIIASDGDINLSGSLTIAQDLTVNGTTTTVNTETLAVEDPLISLAKDNAANSVDIGFYGRYNDGSNRYLGLYADASDTNTFKLFKGTTTEPTTTVDSTATGYTLANLDVNVLDAQQVYSLDMLINDYIYHNGDINTYLGFPSNDNFVVSTGGNTNLAISSSTVTLKHSGSTKLETVAGGIDVTGITDTDGITSSAEIDVNLASEGKYFEGGSANSRRLSITSGTNISTNALHTFDIASTNGKYEFAVNTIPQLSIDSSLATFAGNVTINKSANPTKLQIGSSLADDPFIHFQTDSENYSIGVDRSDSNKFKISNGSDVATGTRITLDTAGNVGLGIDSPTTYYSGADNLVVYQASGEAGITVATATDTTGALYFADGTSGDQQYRGGIAYTHSTDKLSLVSGGSNKMIIDGSGDVTIETSGADDIKNFTINSSNGSSQVAGFVIQNDGANGYVHFKAGAGGSTPTTKLTLGNAANSGNFGIGEDTPVEILHTNKDSAGDVVGGYFTNSNANTGAEKVSLAFGLNRSGGDFVRQTKAITFGAEQQWTGTPSTVDGYLAFSTMQNETASEKVRITSGGDVGIGTGADVYADLHLEGGQQNILLTNSSADGVAGLTISRIIGQARGYGNNGAAMQSIDFETNSSAWYKGDIVFKTNNLDGTNPAVSAVERLRIASDGDVSLNGGDFYVNGGTNYNDKSNIYLSNGRTLIQSDIVNGTANGDTSLALKTRKAGVEASALFINEFRNVIIGSETQAPSAQLTVSLSDSVGGRISLRNDRTALFDGDEFGRLAFTSSDETYTGDRARIIGRVKDTGAKCDLEFYTGNTTASVQKALTLHGNQTATFDGDVSVGSGNNIYSGSLRNDSVSVPANTSTTVLDFTGAGAGIYMITVCRSGASTGEHAVYIVQWTGSTGGVSTTLHSAGWTSPTFSGANFQVSNGNARTCHATAQPLSLN